MRSPRSTRAGGRRRLLRTRASCSIHCFPARQGSTHATLPRALQNTTPYTPLHDRRRLRALVSAQPRLRPRLRPIAPPHALCDHVQFHSSLHYLRDPHRAPPITRWQERVSTLRCGKSTRFGPVSPIPGWNSHERAPPAVLSPPTRADRIGGGTTLCKTSAFFSASDRSAAVAVCRPRNVPAGPRTCGPSPVALFPTGSISAPKPLAKAAPSSVVPDDIALDRSLAGSWAPTTCWVAHAQRTATFASGVTRVEILANRSTARPSRTSALLSSKKKNKTRCPSCPRSGRLARGSPTAIRREPRRVRRSRGTIGNTAPARLFHSALLSASAVASSSGASLSSSLLPLPSRRRRWDAAPRL